MSKYKIIWGITLLSILFFVSTLAVASELTNLQYEIKSQGAGWTAGETSISKLPLNEQKRRLGLFLPTISPLVETLSDDDSLMKIQAEALPSSLDWRNNGGNFVTPVRDQGSCGSCWAFATAGALESASLKANSTPNKDLDLAEQILVSCSGAGDCDGGYIDEASTFIEDTGLPFETCYPYTEQNGFCGNACSSWQFSTYKINSWRWVNTTNPTIEGLKNALYSFGPLVTMMSVYYDFYSYKSGVYKHVSGQNQGYHAVLMVGYNDTGQYFIVKNSWGDNWGESGYFKIAYSELSNEVTFGSWTIAYTAAPGSSSTLEVNPDSIASGSAVTVTFKNTVTPTTTDWIGLYAAGTSDTAYLAWVYDSSCTQTPGTAKASGSCQFTIPAGISAGTYEFRLFANDGFSRLAVSNALTVTGGVTLPTVTITANDPTATEAGTTTGQFTITRTGATTSALTVNYAVSGTATSGSDYNSIGTSVTIPAGSVSTNKTVTPINDISVENDETVVVTLSSNAAYTVGSPNSATVTITSDDVAALPTVTITANDPTASEAGTTTGQFTITRTGATTSALTVNYAVSGTATPGSDYSSIGTSVTIPAGSASATKTVTPINDTTVENDETVVVTLSSNAAYTVGSPNSATVTITSDDVAALPTVTITANDPTATEAGTTTGQFTITRTGATTSALTVNYAVSGTATSGSDYSSIGTSVTIPAGSASATKTVTPINDTTVENDETVVVTLGSDAAYTVGSPNSATVTITSDDVTGLPTVTITANDPTATEVGTTTGQFTITRTGATTSALTVKYAVSGTATSGSDYSSVGTSVKIPAGSASTTKTVTPINDTTVENDETVVVTLSSNAAYTVGSPNSATVTITSDDGTAFPTVTVSPTIIAGGSAVTVTFNNTGTLSATDWIGLYAAGTPDTDYLDWIYDSSCTQTPGTEKASGSCQFTIPADLSPGTYEFRLFADDGYSRLAVSNALTVTSVTTSLTVTPTSIARGSAVTVTFNNTGTLSTTDWIGLYAAGTPDTAYLDWIYDSSCTQTPGTAKASGSCQFTIPAGLSVGTYEFRLFADDGYSRLEVSNALTVY
jgi:C1A family cysteine protease